jgi:hypothetical protein
MAESATVIQETNPYGNLFATLEDDGRTVYLYVWRPENPEEVKAVWVANRRVAPAEDDVPSMARGLAPMMPRDHTRHPQGVAPMDPGELSLVWFEEGNAVALMRNRQPLAVLPPWSGRHGCAGYSQDAVGQHRLAWELTDNDSSLLADRIARARKFWAARTRPSLAMNIHAAPMARLEARLGPHCRFWLASDRRPRIGIAQFQYGKDPAVNIYVTVGMSAQPQPMVDLYADGAKVYRRVELAFAVEGSPDWAPDLLMELSHYPWDTYHWLGDRHTFQFGESLPVDRADWPTDVLLLRDPPAYVSGSLFKPGLSPAPALAGPVDLAADPVTYLWVMPVSAREREIAQERGPSELVQKLARDGRGWVWQSEGSSLAILRIAA